MTTCSCAGGAAAFDAAVPPDARVAFAARWRATRHRRFGVVAALALMAASSACGLLDDDQKLPDVARVDIAGSAPVDLELIVSDSFERVNDVGQGTRYTVLIHADTSLVRPEFSQEYDIRATRRFFVRLTNHSSEVARITLSVAFDGEVSYSQGANISQGGALEFSEVFFGT